MRTLSEVVRVVLDHQNLKVEARFSGNLCDVELLHNEAANESCRNFLNYTAENSPFYGPIRAKKLNRDSSAKDVRRSVNKKIVKIVKRHFWDWKIHISSTSPRYHTFIDLLLTLLIHRSQLSICSEPPVAIKQLSCQSSIEPCVLEEDITDYDDRENRGSFHTPQSESIIESTVVTIENDRERQQMRNRPDSLILNSTTIDSNPKPTDTKKFLYRSQSTKSFKKPKAKASKVLSNDLDQIYVISSNSCLKSDLNEFYDSIDVIHERRSKNFSKFADSETSGTRNESVTETTVEIEPHEN